MGVACSSLAVYNGVSENENIYSINLKRDVALVDLYSFCPKLKESLLFSDSDYVKDGTSIFVDKKNGAIFICRGDTVYLQHNNVLLNISMKQKQYSFRSINGNTYCSIDLEDDEKNFLYGEIMLLLDEFETIFKYVPIGNDRAFVCLGLGVVDKNNTSEVVKGDKVTLYLEPFRELRLSKLKLIVADKSTYEKVGSIEASLNKQGEDNFSYTGNVFYDINEKFCSKGYATDALASLIRYINENAQGYNKDLYVASVVDDLAYQKVALNNGGVLEYEGAIPGEHSPLDFNKIKNVKIYKLSNK